MNRRTFLTTVPAVAVIATRSFAGEPAASRVLASDLQPINLAKPEKDGGKSVIAALWERRTTRAIADKKLSPQTLSNLLWAAWGVNRETGPNGRVGRTAASAHNVQEIDLYVVLPEGVYLYEAESHRLAPVLAGDHRKMLGGRDRADASLTAPVSLVFIADVSRSGQRVTGATDTENQMFCYHVATGLIAGNVHLFAASQGLAAWFHGCDKAALAARLKLRREQRVIYAQTVGYPA